METRVSYTIVGGFVLLFISAIVLAIIWLSSGFTFQQFKTYKIYMQESVSGLNIESPVEYNGVQVGNVKSIELDHQNPQLVELLLSIKDATPITVGTVATLQTRGITGITFVALKDKSENLTPLTAQRGDPYPVIKTAPSLFTRLDTALNKLTDNLHDVSVAFNKLLDDENLRSIKDTLANMRRITGTLARNDKKMNDILVNMDVTSKNMSKASKRLTPLMSTTTDAMRMLQTQTLPATYKLMVNLNHVSKSFGSLVSQLEQNPSALVRGVDRESVGPGEDG